MTGPITRDTESDPLQALRDELAGVAPSPEFATRVRQELEPAGRLQVSAWGWGEWLGVVAPAFVVVVIVAASTFRPGPTAPSAEVGRQGAGLPTPLAAEPEREIARERQPEHSSTGSGHQGTRPASLGTPEPEYPGTPAPEQPSLVVLTNQPEVLRALWARARVPAGTVVVEAPAAQFPHGPADIVVAPIEVNPIVVPWLVEPPESPGSPPIIR